MKNKKPKRVVVIGAGPAGLTAAYVLAKKKFDVQVLEASPYVGGLSRSFELWGQIVDLGPHRFFSRVPEVNQLWHEVVDGEYTHVNRLTRIYYRDRFFFYPLRPWNALRNLGPQDVIRCLLSYSLAGPARGDSFEDWIVQRFGRRLFEIFFKTYSEKLWGIPCDRIDADWASQRIKQFSLKEALRTALFGDGDRKHPTLVDQFAYPNRGTGSIYWKMAERVIDEGGEVSLLSPVAKVLTSGENDSLRATGVVLKDGRQFEADEVISTMPLPLMVKSLDSAPESVRRACDSLRFRSTLLVYLEVNASQLFPDNWIYVHSPDVLHGRITNFRNWCPSLNRGKSTTILCLEFWCFEKDDLWQKNDTSLAELAEKELRQISLLSPETAIFNSFVVRIPRSYPVYERGYRGPLTLIQDFLKTVSHLYAIGRYGSFKYNNQDHSILMGLLAAKEIETGIDENLWSINTDSEYQESAVTTAWETASPGARRDGPFESGGNEHRLPR